MINELYGLAEALDRAGIVTEHTHVKYKLIPKVSGKAPCVHMIFDQGKLYEVESIEAQQAEKIRKYGSNQGTFPALNLAPLYRLTDETEKKMISELFDRKTTDFDVKEIRRLCRENNWGKKFENKFRISMVDVPHEMTELLQKAGIVCAPFLQIVEETRAFTDAAALHEQLENAVFEMLEQKTEIAFALRILFYLGNQEKNKEEDYGTLSVVLDSRKLVVEGMSVAAANFTTTLNRELLAAEGAALSSAAGQELDAFGLPLEPIEEPMPRVKLAAGFEVSLRTMFHGQPCQSRYGRLENATYPIAKEMRFRLQSALAWISSAERREITWLNIDKEQTLFAYREVLQENMYSLVDFLRRQRGEVDGEEKRDRSREFEDAAKAFISEMKKTKEPGTDPMSEGIQYFILKKVDRARTRTVYTYNTSPAQIERCSEEWTLGCRNLPAFTFGQPRTLYPLEVSDILNRVWRLDGKASSEKYKPFPHYCGMKLLFGEEPSAIRRDLFVLMSNAENLAVYLGRAGLPGKWSNEWPEEYLYPIWKTLALTGLLLYQLGIRKENYMQDFPYLFGQLLKASDGLHAMYCRVVRSNDVPNILAGSALYTAGAERPYETLGLLGTRMSPYIAWAKTYRMKGIQKVNEESWRAGWYCALYEKLATQLYAVWGKQTRFNEEEKARYFVGYLAEFPKKEKEGDQNDR